LILLTTKSIPFSTAISTPLTASSRSRHSTCRHTSTDSKPQFTGGLLYPLTADQRP
jgi:hypothetical protein